MPGKSFLLPEITINHPFKKDKIYHDITHTSFGFYCQQNKCCFKVYFFTLYKSKLSGYIVFEKLKV